MIESPFRFSFLFERDLFGKPATTFPDHAVDDSKSNGTARACAGIAVRFAFAIG
jgi:hypothetical protein